RDPLVTGVQTCALPISVSPDDWRDTTLVDFHTLAFDRINVTNSGKYLGLQYDLTNNVWRMTDPMPVRADTQRINELLRNLATLKIGRASCREREQTYW